MSTSITTRRTRLTDKNVSRILAKCIHVASCPTQTCSTVEVEGIHKNFVFDKNILEAERSNIENMLKELPKRFKQGGSFGEMYHTEKGRQWTGSFKTMEELMVLGVAIGKLNYPVPKTLWWSLPGGMPYIISK